MKQKKNKVSLCSIRNVQVGEWMVGLGVGGVLLPSVGSLALTVFRHPEVLHVSITSGPASPTNPRAGKKEHKTPKKPKTKQKQKQNLGLPSPDTKTMPADRNQWRRCAKSCRVRGARVASSLVVFRSKW